jgi:hypothetical protein
LAILAACLGRALWTASGQGTLPRAGAVLLAGLASAALWGAIFHAFFPDNTATSSGFAAWVPVVLSIVVAATAMLELALRTLMPRLPPRVRPSLVATYAAGFLAVALLVDESFTTIVRFYLPVLLLLLMVAGLQAIRHRSAGWALIALGLTISVGAALLQQAEVSIHPVHFDHNAVYHVVQGFAVVALYLGFRRVPQAPPRASRQP